MQRVLTVAPVMFGSGTMLGLSAEQARTRAHVLKATDQKGVYEAVSTLQFKKGEELRVAEASIDRAMRERLEPMDGEPMDGEPLDGKKLKKSKKADK